MKLIDAENKVKELLKLNGLNNWTFVWKRRIENFNSAGTCRYSKKQILLAPVYVELNNEKEVLDSILHEIAHALMKPPYIQNNKWVHCGHNRIWKAKAIEIGCTGSRCVSDEAIIKR